MTWQEKMDRVIGEVLGEGYNVKVIDETQFEVYFVDMFVLKTTTVNLLSNHWRKQIHQTILLIIDKNIQAALSKIK